MADFEWIKPTGRPTEQVRQASEDEIAQAHQMRITRKTGAPTRHPLDDPRDAMFTNTDVRINYEHMDDWLGVRARRSSQAPVPVQRCGHCRMYPVSDAPMRPSHPHMALLCSTCRGRVYLMAAETADRTGRRLFEHLNAILSDLCLGE
jgi:hypothetical protein